MAEVVTAVLYTEDFSSYKLADIVCVSLIQYFCAYISHKKKSIKRALLLMLDKQEAFTSSFYGHSHISSAVLMMEACATIVSVN